MHAVARTGRRRSKTDQETIARLYVVGIISVFVALMLVLVSLNVRSNSQQAAAKQSIGRAFVQVGNRQGEFWTLSGRYATWEELQKDGMTLGPNQSVAASNSDASHWFLSIRDEQTGLVCDRIGGVTDELSSRRPPVCRKAP